MRAFAMWWVVFAAAALPGRSWAVPPGEQAAREPEPRDRGDPRDPRDPADPADRGDPGDPGDREGPGDPGDEAVHEIALSPRPMSGPPAGATPQERDQWLAARLNLLLAGRPDLAAARIGVAVVDVATGKTLYARAADETFQIASLAELITTGTALAALGPEFRFKTSIYVDAMDDKGTVAGNVYLRGRGDPTLTTLVLGKLAADLKLAGVKRVTKAVVIDGTFFDAELPPAFDRHREDTAFRAKIAAAALNDGFVTVLVQPGAAAGKPARVTLDPASSYFVVTNTATTVEHGRTSIRVISLPREDRTEIQVTGQIRLDASEPVTVRKRVGHPDLYLGHTLRAFLEAQGIRLEGPGVHRGTVPPGARALVTHYSEPLSVLVRDLNKYSNHFMAEMLLVGIGAERGGAPGSFRKGLAVVHSWLAEAGIAPGSYRFESGSGLFDVSRFSPAQIARLLRHAYLDFRIGSDFVAALALAGADGTIRHRMVGGAAERYVRAKSGTDRGVSCLAGYAGAVGKSPVAFAVLANDVPGHLAHSVRALQDDVAQVLVLYLEGGAR